MIGLTVSLTGWFVSQVYSHVNWFLLSKILSEGRDWEEKRERGDTVIRLKISN